MEGNRRTQVQQSRDVAAGANGRAGGGRRGGVDSSSEADRCQAEVTLAASAHGDRVPATEPCNRLDTPVSREAGA